MSTEINIPDLCKNTAIVFYYKDYRHNDFDWSILQDLKNNGTTRNWIAGGFLRRLIAGESVKGADIDLWFSNKPTLYIEGAEETAKSKWAISYKYKDYKLQVIRTKFYDPQNIFNYFDFYSCWWYSSVLDDIHDDFIVIRTFNKVAIKYRFPGEPNSYFIRAVLPKDLNYIREEVTHLTKVGYVFGDIELMSPYEETVKRKLSLNSYRHLRIFPNRFVKYLNMGMIPSCPGSIELYKEYLVKGTDYKSWDTFTAGGRVDKINHPYNLGANAPQNAIPADGWADVPVQAAPAPRLFFGEALNNRVEALPEQGQADWAPQEQPGGWVGAAFPADIPQQANRNPFLVRGAVAHINNDPDDVMRYRV